MGENEIGEIDRVAQTKPFLGGGAIVDPVLPEKSFQGRNGGGNDAIEYRKWDFMELPHP